MNQAFYDGMIIRIQGGQYALDEIDIVIDKAAGKGFFGTEFDKVIAELKTLARKYVDPSYKGSAEPRSYDLLQDIEIESNSMATLEIFEIVTILENQLAESELKIAALEDLVKQFEERIAALEELTTTPSPL